MYYLIIELETLLRKTGKTSTDIMRATGHTAANVSKLKTGKIKSIRLQTLLDVCNELDCQPGDLIKRVSEDELESLIMTRGRAAAGISTDPNTETAYNVYVVDLTN